MIFNTYLPTILKSVHGLSAQEASSITGLISLAGLFSCLLYAPIVGRNSRIISPSSSCL